MTREPIKIDLISTPKTRTVKVWLNVYDNGYAYGYPTPGRAITVAESAAVAVIVAIPLEITYQEK